MTCLDDETVLGLVEGRLAAGALVDVESHLDGCASCRELITHVATAEPAPRALAHGQTLGRYVIGELVGAGAMGRVYAAWQPELDRRVAVKVLADDDPRARERLVAEAQAMARLDHPNVVGVHEVGTTDEVVYVAMELVTGESLRAWCDAPRPWRQVARVLAETARGLAAVHAAGVIHRDVKPDNIIVGNDGRARVGDFGLARAGSGAASTRALASGALAVGTPSTSVAGTPAYMAPEVLRGGPATRASDQFAFGVSAYELLAGGRPFPGSTWRELLAAIETRAPARLRDVPRWLDDLVRRCLAPDPERRWPSFAGIADALDANLARRRRAPWIVGAATAMAATGVATWYLAAPDAPARCDLVAAPFEAAPRPALDVASTRALEAWTAHWRSARIATCEATRAAPSAQLAAREACLEARGIELAALLARVTPATRERFTDALVALSPGDCAAARPNTADALPLDPDRAAAARDVATQLPAVRAAIALADAGSIDASLTTIVERAKTSQHAPTLAEALLARAEADRLLSRLPAAERAAREAIGAAERGHADEIAARAWLARVQIAGDRRELALADELAALAAAAIDRAGAPPRLVALLLRTRGLIAFARGDHAQVQALLGDARARLVALSGEHSLDVAGIETALGIAARVRGDLDAAQRHHEAALALDRALRGERHPDIARDLHNLAGLARLRGDLAGALARYEAALELETALRGPSSVQTGLTHNSIGLVKLAQRDLAGARAHFERALAALATAGHGDRAFPEHNLGLVAAAAGDHRTALAHFDRAAATYVATIGLATDGPQRLADDRARSEQALRRVTRARARRPTAVVQPPPPDAPAPKPKDVGVYGSSGGW